MESFCGFSIPRAGGLFYSKMIQRFDFPFYSIDLQ